MDAIGALKKVLPQGSLAPLHHVRMQAACDRKMTLTRPCWSPDLRLPDSRTVNNELLLFTSPRCVVPERCRVWGGRAET